MAVRTWMSHSTGVPPETVALPAVETPSAMRWRVRYEGCVGLPRAMSESDHAAERRLNQWAHHHLYAGIVRVQVVIRCASHIIPRRGGLSDDRGAVDQRNPTGPRHALEPQAHVVEGRDLRRIALGGRRAPRDIPDRRGPELLTVLTRQRQGLRQQRLHARRGERVISGDWLMQQDARTQRRDVVGQ